MVELLPRGHHVAQGVALEAGRDLSECRPLLQNMPTYNTLLHGAEQGCTLPLQGEWCWSASTAWSNMVANQCNQALHIVQCSRASMLAPLGAEQWPHVQSAMPAVHLSEGWRTSGRLVLK